MPVLPEAQGRVRADHHHGRAGGEAVEPVGEVHGVRHGHDHEDEQQDRAHLADVEPVDVLDERDEVAADGLVPVAGQVQRDDAEDGADQGLADQLGAHVQAEAVLLADLEVVVDEPEHAGTDEQPQQHDPGRGGRGGGELLLHLRQGEAQGQVAGHVGEHGTQDEHHPTHGRGALLGQVGLRSLAADRLVGPQPGEQPDGQRGQQDRQDERHERGDDDRSHAVVPASSRRASTTSQVRYREPFTRTTSPGRSSSRSSSTAAG